MNNLLLGGMVIGVIAVSAGASCAGSRMLSAKEPSTSARILSVDEARTYTQTSREGSEDVFVTAQKPIKDKRRVAGNMGGTASYCSAHLKLPHPKLSLPDFGLDHNDPDSDV